MKCIFLSEMFAVLQMHIANLSFEADRIEDAQEAVTAELEGTATRILEIIQEMKKI